jgi:hypothetical protein
VGLIQGLFFKKFRHFKKGEKIMPRNFHPKMLIFTLILLLFNISIVSAMPPHPDMEPELRVQAVEVYLHAKERWPQLNAPGPLQQPAGTYRAIVLLVDFSDNIGQESKSLYEDLLFSSGTYPTGSMRDYYREVSYNQFDVIGDVNGTVITPNWYRMPKPMTIMLTVKTVLVTIREMRRN